MPNPVRSLRPLAAAAVAAALTACSDAPSAPTLYVTPLTLCAQDWLAYQNEGGSWTQAQGNGRYTFEASERVAIATVRTRGDLPWLHVAYLTATQAAKSFPCSDGTIQPPLASIIAEMKGIAPGDAATVSFGPFSTVVRQTGLQFSLPLLTAQDLLAGQFVGDSVLTRMILRRGVTTSGRDTVRLDFGSSEAFVPAQATLSYTGPRGHLQTSYTTTTGTAITLQSDIVGNGTGSVAQRAPLLGMQSTRIFSGDVHRAFLSLTFGPEDNRVVRWAYFLPTDTDVRVGEALQQPTFSWVTRGAGARPRVQLPVQGDYDGAVWVGIDQERQTVPVSGRVSVTLVASREYFGTTPSAWTLTVPDLRGVPGYPFPGLTDGAFRWSATAYNAAAFRPESELPIPQGSNPEFARQASSAGTVP